MNRILLVMIIGCFFLLSCQQEIPIILTPKPSNNYQPFSKNSYWKYRDSSMGELSKLISLNNTVFLNNQAYNVFKTEIEGQAPEESYLRISDHEYALLGNLSNNLGGIELIYLYDNKPVGHKWSYIAGIVNGLPGKVNGELLETNIIKTVLGKTYSEVMHTRLKLLYDLGQGLGYQVFAEYNYYIAKNIGIIRIETNINAITTSLRTVSDLKEYSIK